MNHPVESLLLYLVSAVQSVIFYPQHDARQLLKVPLSKHEYVLVKLSLLSFRYTE